MMNSKMNQIKEWLSAYGTEQQYWTVNSLHRKLTGVESGVRWHKAIINCSHSTVRRALESIVNESNDWHSHFPYGDAYDEKRYFYLGDIPF